MCNHLPIIVFILLALTGCGNNNLPQEPKTKPNNKPIYKSIVSHTTTFDAPISQQPLNIYTAQDSEELVKDNNSTIQITQKVGETNERDNKTSDKKKISKEGGADTTSKMNQSTGDIPTRKRKFLEGKLGGSFEIMKRTFSDGIEKVKKFVKK
jgi:hypothetical protein